VPLDDALLSLEESTRELDISDVPPSSSRPDEGDEPAPVPPASFADAQAETGRYDLPDSIRSVASSGAEEVREQQLLAELREEASSAGADPGRELVEALLERAEREFTDGESGSAAILVSYALSESGESAAAQKLIYERENALVRMLIECLGELSARPALTRSMTDIPLGLIDARAAFLLSRVDGSLTLDEVLDISGMTKLEALSYLSRLHANGFLEVR
jgi:hypothetical protein